MITTIMMNQKQGLTDSVSYPTMEITGRLLPYSVLFNKVKTRKKNGPKSGKRGLMVTKIKIKIQVKDQDCLSIS